MSEDKKPERPDVDHSHHLLDFPSGSGDPHCPKCKGRGVVPVMMDVGGGVIWPGGGTENCICVFKRDLLINVKRIWKVLLTVESVNESPLLKLTKQSLWITASQYDFRQHMRFVAFRMGPRWDARVIADATLMTAWLSTAKDVYDSDVLLEREGFERDRPSEHFATLVDIAVPFDLLVIQLGVKAAANKEMANVLTEAIHEREQVGKPTWVVDSFHAPVTDVNHKCHSPMVMELLDGFRRVVLGTEQEAQSTGGAAQYTRRKAPVASSAAPTGLGSPYTRRKGGMGATAPSEPPADEPFQSMPLEDDGRRSEAMPDDDEYSVDTLFAEAHDPKLAPEGEGLLVEDDGGAREVEALLEDFPSPDELGGNTRQLPEFLRGALTKEERLAKDRQKKREKRWEKNRGGGDR